MREITLTVCSFEELSDKAKQAARENFRFSEEIDFDIANEIVEEDSKYIGKMLGIDVTKLYWTGFHSQGDGASFEGTYKFKAGAVEAIKAEMPTDEKIHLIAEDLEFFYNKYNETFELVAPKDIPEHTYITVKCDRSHYCHANTMDFEIANDEYETSPFVDDDYLEVVGNSLRDFANWIYKRLNDAYDYQNSDEGMDEYFEDSEIEFFEDGTQSYKL